MDVSMRKKPGRKRKYDDLPVVGAWALSREGEKRKSPYRTSGHSIRGAQEILRQAVKAKILPEKYKSIHVTTINRVVHRNCSSADPDWSVEGSTVYDRDRNIIFPYANVVIGNADFDIEDAIEMLRLPEGANCDSGNAGGTVAGEGRRFVEVANVLIGSADHENPIRILHDPMEPEESDYAFRDDSRRLP